MKNRDRKLDRNFEIVADRQQGMSFKEIAEKHQISISRVRQIIEVWKVRNREDWEVEHE